MKPLKESQIQHAILQYLAAKKVLAWKNTSVGIFNQKTGHYIPVGRRGVSDICALTQKGKFIAIEVKNPKGGIVSEYQQSFLDDVTAHGGVAIVARSIDDVMKIL